MLYTKPSFTVPATNDQHRDPTSCKHGWLDARGRCMYCGQPSKAATVASFAAMRAARHSTSSFVGLAVESERRRYERGYDRAFGGGLDIDGTVVASGEKLEFIPAPSFDPAKDAFEVRMHGYPMIAPDAIGPQTGE